MFREARDGERGHEGPALRLHQLDVTVVVADLALEQRQKLSTPGSPAVRVGRELVGHALDAAPHGPADQPAELGGGRQPRRHVGLHALQDDVAQLAGADQVLLGGDGIGEAHQALAGGEHLHPPSTPPLAGQVHPEVDLPLDQPGLLQILDGLAQVIAPAALGAGRGAVEPVRPELLLVRPRHHQEVALSVPQGGYRPIVLPEDLFALGVGQEVVVAGAKVKPGPSASRADLQTLLDVARCLGHLFPPQPVGSQRLPVLRLETQASGLAVGLEAQEQARLDQVAELGDQPVVGPLASVMSNCWETSHAARPGGTT